MAHMVVWTVHGYALSGFYVGDNMNRRSKNINAQMIKHNLVLVPGLMCDHSVWDPLLEGISPLAGAQIIDHGQADSLVDMAHQLLALAPPRFALAGHSMGGRVALEVMRLAPQRVTHLALMDTGYLPKAAGAAGEAEVAKRMTLVALAHNEGVRAMALQWVQGMVATHRLSDAVLIESVVAMLDRKSAQVFARQIKALIERPDASDVLRQLQLPTLVLCGAQDSWSNPAQHEEIAALIPARPAVVSVPDAGHMVTMERPDAVVQAFKDWLSMP